MFRICALAVAFLAALTLSVIARTQSVTYDLLLKNARIVDGTGGAWYRADIGVKGDTIVAIAPGLTGGASRTIDVAGQVVKSLFA